MIELAHAVGALSRTPDPDAPTLGERIDEVLRGIDYGTVLITVHDGKPVQIDTTRRERFAR